MAEQPKAQVAQPVQPAAQPAKIDRAKIMQNIPAHLRPYLELGISQQEELQKKIDELNLDRKLQALEQKMGERVVKETKVVSEKITKQGTDHTGKLTELEKKLADHAKSNDEKFVSIIQQLETVQRILLKGAIVEVKFPETKGQQGQEPQKQG